jgi:hypothetical protein
MSLKFCFVKEDFRLLVRGAGQGTGGRLPVGILISRHPSDTPVGTRTSEIVLLACKRAIPNSCAMALVKP